MSKSKCEAKSFTSEFHEENTKWETIRNQWLQAKYESSLKEIVEIKTKNLDMEEVIEIIFSQTGNGMLKEPVPLAQMVYMLTEIWEADGLYE